MHIKRALPCFILAAVHSIYFRDSNGYVIELTAKTPAHNGARGRLERWTATKRQRSASAA